MTTTAPPPRPANVSRLGAVVHLERLDNPGVLVTTRNEYVVLTPRYHHHTSSGGVFAGLGHVHPLERLPAGRYLLMVTIDGMSAVPTEVYLAETADPPDTVTVTVTVTMTVVGQHLPTDPGEAPVAREPLP